MYPLQGKRMDGESLTRGGANAYPGLYYVALSGHRTVKGCFIQVTGTDQEDHRQKRAAPNGNLTSQFFANVYLNELDHFVKRHLKCRYGYPHKAGHLMSRDMR